MAELPRQQPDPADAVALATQALERGQAEIARGDTNAARRWFERACRLAPHDDTARLCLAGILVGQDDVRAADLFADVVTRHDVRPAWLGLALARLRLGDTAAAAALGTALSRFVTDRPPEIAALADRIARDFGAPGWCGLGPDGAVVTGAAGSPALALDGVGVAVRNLCLPRGWQAARRLDVNHPGDGRPFLGSPIDIAALCRTQGCVWASDGGLEGWAWHPGNPAANPTLLVRTMSDSARRKQGRKREGKPDALSVLAEDLEATISGIAVLAQPRRFRVPAVSLAGLAGRLSVIGTDGRHLSGSPLDPGVESRDAATAALAIAARFPAGEPAKSPAGRTTRRPPPDVVIPVHGGGQTTLDCIASVLATLPRASRLIVVDDATPDPDLARALRDLAARRRIHLIRQGVNQGFPASANAGIRICAGRDVVLLNSDTLVPPWTPPLGHAGGWIERLRQAAYAAADIGTVTPLSNDASILSYPGLSGANPVPSLNQTAQLDRIAAQVNAGKVVDIPTAVGFCMYIRHDCLSEVGALREDVFAQGYGEENDFCVRAGHLRWRHVAAPDVFIAHLGGRSFGPARAHLLARNAEVLDRLHPGYAAAVARHALADPLAEARRNIDAARWRQGRRRGAGRRATLLITHFHGGGTERQIGVRSEAVRGAGLRPVVLRPVRLADGSAAAMVGEGAATDYPNLRFALPAELPALLRLLAGEGLVGAELHHLLGHDYAVLQVIDRLALPYDVHVHDSAAYCPRIGLLGPDRRYCGEPDVAHCEACIADIGRKDGLDIPVAELRRLSAGILRGARSVVVPSQDTAARIRRHFPETDPVISPHGDDAAIADPPPPRAVRQPGTGRPVCRVAVIGALGLEKGYEVLLACARDAAWRDLPLEFVVIGHSIDDARLLATGLVFVTGEYRPEEAVELIRAQQASLALVASIWPETWCFTLTEAWQAGLTAFCFDIGAPAERIRRKGRGFVLPLGLPAGAINHAMVAAAGLARHEGA